MKERNAYRSGRLTARTLPKTASGKFAAGVHTLPLNSGKPALLYVPATKPEASSLSLVVLLHGAGGTAAQGLSLLRDHADANGVLILAPSSQDYTWDLLAGDAFGPDVILFDSALAYLFEHFEINASLAIGGFSDGASYALCIGLTNGDLFTHIIAFSPGFYHTRETHGRPAVFISHGTRDDVLPIDPCSRRIVPKLRREGIEAAYREFNGRHEIPHSISAEAIQWFTGSNT